MLPCSGVLVLVIFLSTCGSYADVSDLFDITYLYSSNLTEISQPDKPLGSIAARVFVTPYLFSTANSTDGHTSPIRKLLHVLVEFDRQGVVSSTKVELIAEFEKYGMLSRLHLPLNKAIKMTEENLIKGLISLFVIRTSFVPGSEIDSSGTCHVSYTTPNQKGANSDLIEIHKVKSSCQETQYPVDVWNHSLIPIFKLHKAQQAHTHYLLNAASGHVVRATSYEEQTITTLSGTNVNIVKLLSLQELMLLKGSWTPKVLQRSEDADETVARILGAVRRTVHLAPIYPVSDSKNPCSLNFHLHPYLTPDISLAELRSWIEGARDALHAQQIGHMKPLHRAIQLTRMLRCLPHNPESVDLLTRASTLSPPSIDSRMIYRQSGSWRDQLVDVLVVCGTPTCLTVVVRRLEALTEAASLNSTNYNTVTREAQLAQAMLFNKLWPQLAHIERPLTEQFEKMLKCCQAAIILPNRVVCLTALANLWSKISSEDSLLRAQLLSSVEELLDGTLGGFGQVSTKNGQQPETANDKNSRILAAVTMTEALNAVELLNPLLSLINLADLYPSVRAAVIRVFGKLSSQRKLGGKQELGHNVEIDEVEKLLTNLLLEETEENLVVDREIVYTLVLLNPYPEYIKKLFSKLVTQNRWSLIRECRLRMKWLCEYDTFPSMLCTCLTDGNLCDLGVAGGWSGLAVAKATAIYSSTSTQGELFNINNTLVMGYLLQLTNGENGELCTSNLVVDLLSPNGKNRLLQFAINTNGLETFTNNIGSRNSSRAASATEGAWLNLELRYFTTSLPPWTVFQGGMTSLGKALWSASSEPASVLQFLRSFVDERYYSSFLSGWILSLDTLGLLSVDLSAAMHVSIFSRSGRSLVRFRLAVVSETYLHVVQETESVLDSNRALVKGFGGDGELDFVTHVRVSDLPDGVCMAMNRGNDFQSLIWEGTRLVSDFRPVPTGILYYRDLAEHSDYHILQSVNLPGVSFDLGKFNTERCIKMGGTFLW